LRKTILLLLIISAFLLGCPKKDPYKIQKPESVVWSPVTKTYLISNAGSGIILSLIDKYKFEIFNKFKLISPKGMAIHQNTLYVADVYRVVGLDLKTGKKTFLHKFPKSSFLNDVDTSPDGKVYVSDTQNNLLYILTPATDKVETIRDKALYRPNGLYYVKLDGAENLYIASFQPKAKIQVLNLKTKTITSLPGTEVPLADGITREIDGSWLVSSWGDSLIYKFSPDFTVRSSFYEKYRSPADIFYSKENKELAVPHFETNQVSFITQVDSTMADSLKTLQSKKK
jgi:DNA-binding beta-propeller fold protein YncE